MEIKELAKKYWPYAVGGLVLLGGGVGLGWELKPDQVRIEERIKTVEVEKQVIVTQERTVFQVVKVKDTQVVADTHKERTEEKKPDGTVVIKETEDQHFREDNKETSNGTKTDEVAKAETDEKTKTVDEVKITEPVETKWHLGVLVGVAPQLPNVLESPLILGLEGERRVLGPFYLGVWVMAGTPVVGVPKLTNLTAGLKLGAEF